MTETEAPQKKPARPALESVIIRPWPKVVFLYPTLLFSLVFWFIELLQGDGPTQTGPDGTVVVSQVGDPTLGMIFMIVFFLNLMLFSFDFSRIKSITLVIGIVALILAVGWANSNWGIVDGLKSIMDNIDIRMNTQFFGWMSAFLTFVMVIVLINTRFNYFEVNHRELLHHHGYLGDINRMPTAGLRFNKEIYDLLEFLLLRSGRLIFYPQTAREAIVIDNVINVNDVERRLKDLLSVVAVRMTDEEQF